MLSVASFFHFDSCVRLLVAAVLDPYELWQMNTKMRVIYFESLSIKPNKSTQNSNKQNKKKKKIKRYRTKVVAEEKKIHEKVAPQNVEVKRIKIHMETEWN